MEEAVRWVAGGPGEAAEKEFVEQANSKLKRLVANLSLDNLVLKDIAIEMYGPLRFCKRRVLLTHSGLRKCIRPLASRPLLAAVHDEIRACCSQ